MKIKSKKYIKYSGKVYDLQIKSQDHSYNINNLVVHNSVVGSLVSMMLGITTIDPIKNDLLFERFLNPTRVMPEKFFNIKLDSGEKLSLKEDVKVESKNGEPIPVNELNVGDYIKDSKIKSIDTQLVMRKDSMPDVDLDTMSEYRDVVKQYISERFGELHTCSIGAYQRLKLKSGLKDFGRAKGLSFDYVNIITKDIDQELEYTWRKFIIYAIESKDGAKDNKKLRPNTLYEFIQKYPDLAHCIKYSLNQAKSASIHASAVIIVPDRNSSGKTMDIFNWMPVRMVDGKYVSEWEGLYIDKAGFLKEDMLSLDQLDKFEMIKRLIKRNHDVQILESEIPLDDEKAYKLFHRGMTEDIFQFGSSGLKNYSIQVKPDSLDDVTAMSALYRPGPMSSNAHTDFGLIKHGKKKPEYDYGLKSVTESTNGLYVFQEQIMRAVVVLGGFSLAESENLRTAIKKFDRKEMGKGEEKFVNGAIERGCGKEAATKIWNKLLAFSGYGFNKSHSSAYSHMSVWAAWFKANYPLEFWTTSLNFAKDDNVSKRISELKKLKQGLSIKPPSINKSTGIFDCDKDTQTIYWSLTKIKGCGDSAVNAIVAERERGGLFSDYDDFVKRVPKSKVNRGVIEVLIVSGALDECEHITKEIERFDLLKKHYNRLNLEIKNVEKHEKIPEIYTKPEAKKNYYWILLQKELTGFGDVDYKNILLNHPEKNVAKKLANLYVNGEQFSKAKDYEEVCIAGMCIYAKENKTKKGEKYMTLNIVSNNDLLFLLAWPDTYEKYYDFLSTIKDKTVAISGKCKWDDYRGQTVLFLNIDCSKMLEI